MLRLIFIVIFGILSVCAAQENENIEQVSRLFNRWTFGQNLDVEGKYVYVASGVSGLQIIDVSNPADPVIVGVWDDNPNNSFSVKVQGDYAYVLERDFFLTVVDVSEPRNPRPVGNFEFDGHYFYDLDVAGNLAYLCRASDPGELIIVDISVPDDIFEVGRQFTEKYIHEIEVEGDYAYMTGVCQTEGFTIMDVSNPEEPVSAGGITTPRHGFGLAVQGHYAFYSGYNYGSFNIVDIADRDDPEVIGSIDMEVDYSDGVDVSGEFAFVCANRELHIIDISDLEHPEIMSSVEHEQLFTLDVEVEDDIAYVVCRDGLMIVDIHNRQQPEIIGTLIKWGMKLSLDVRGDYVYVVDQGTISEWAQEHNTGQGLSVINISNPESPEEVFFTQDYGYNLDILINGDYAYLAGRHEPLRTLDLTDPEEPRVIDVNEQGDQLLKMDMQDTLLAVSASSDGMYLFDISEPEHPQLLGQCDPGGYIQDVVIAGNYVYTAHHGAGMQVIDISDPTNPVRVAARSDSMFFNVEFYRDHAYLVGKDHVYIYDVSEPEDPELVERIENVYHYHDQAGGLLIYGDYLILSNGMRGLRIFDISDPANPTETGFYQTPGSSCKTVIVEGTAYIADQTNFGIYDCREALGINIPPEIVDAPRDIIIVDEGDTLIFEIHAEDANDDNITLEMLPVDLPDTASFTDNGNGAGTLEWITDFDDAGFYHPVFVASDGISTDSAHVIIMVRDVNAISDTSVIPVEFAIEKTYPNPFNSSTTISYSLPIQSDIRLEVRDTNGRLVDVLVDRVVTAGRHLVVWDGSGASAGVYIVRLHDGVSNLDESCKVLLVK